MDYYDDLRDSGTGITNFEQDTNINASVANAFPILPSSLTPSKINANYNFEWGVHGRVPGIGLSILTPSRDPYGHIQASFNIGLSNADAKKAQQLIDFDGDGIQDIIYRLPNSGLYVSSGTLSNNTLSFTSPKKLINLNSNFSQTGTKTDQIGYDAGISIFGGAIKFNFSQIWSTSKSDTPVYLSDANSDGLMDVVKDGEVWFNKLNSNDVPEMTKFSDNTENMIMVADAVTEHQSPMEGWYEISKNDVVKMWIAPKAGYIKFTDNIQIENVSGAKAVYSVEIQNPTFGQNNTLKNGRIYLNVLTPSLPMQSITINKYNDYFPFIQSLSPPDINNHWESIMLIDFM